MVRFIEIRTRLQSWEGGRIARVGPFVNRLKAGSPRLTGYSLATMYERQQSELTIAVAALAEQDDPTAREILAIINPARPSGLPESEAVEDLRDEYHEASRAVCFRQAEKMTTFTVKGITLAADRYTKDEKFTRYIIGTSFHLGRNPRLLSLTKKMVLVGLLSSDETALERMRRLRGRIINGRFYDAMIGKDQLAVISIRELLPGEGEPAEAFVQDLTDPGKVVCRVLAAGKAGVTEVDAHIGEVLLY